MAATAFAFILTSLLATPKILCITLDVGTLESISQMRPPPLPPHSRSTGFPARPVPNRAPAPQFILHPQAIQQPSVIISGGIRSVQNNFGQLQQSLSPGQQNRPLPQLLESTNRRPQHFSDVQTIPFGFSLHDISNKQPPDSFIPASAQHSSFNLQTQQLNTPFIQQGNFPQTVIDSSNRQPTNGIVTSSSQQNKIINHIQTNQQSKQSITLPSSNSQQFSLNSQSQTQHLADNVISATVSVQPQPQNLLIQNPDLPWGQTSAQPSEVFSDFNRTFFGRQFEQNALKITAPPVLGPAANDANKKALLKDVLSEDCPRAKEDGFCASPPRYPSQQVSHLISRCSEIVKALYVPVPQDDGRNTTEVKNDAEENLLSPPHFNSTSEMQRGNRQLWSWAKTVVEQETACGAQRQWVEPGYARDSNGHWYVVLQAGDSLAQRVHLETCHSPGKPCSAIKCSSFSNKLATSHCVQRYSYSHLIVWNPDQQDVCPQMRVFRFPTACVCYLGP